MIVSVAIMAHPSRARYVPALQERLPGAVVVLDQKNDRWDTGRRSMLAFDPVADWHLVVQDDTLLCRGFLHQVHEALAEVVEGPAAFYCGKAGRLGPYSSTVVIQQAFRRGEHWVKAPGPYWGPAVAVRPSDIPPMIEWCDPRTEIPNYDRRMSRYFDSIGRLCWYSVPCLVEHRTGMGNPSLVEGRGSSPGRTAALWRQSGRSEWMKSAETPLIEAHEIPRASSIQYTPLRRRPLGPPRRKK